MRKLLSPDMILPTRMNLRVPADTAFRFSLLEFPYDEALKEFNTRFGDIHYKKHGKKVPFELRLPYRQLNSVLLALAPGLIQGFEGLGEGKKRVGRMAVFTRYGDDAEGENPKIADDFPSQENLRDLIKMWVERWRDLNSEVKSIVNGEGKDAWNALFDALNNEPENEWRHNINPAEFIEKFEQFEGGIAYSVLPALLTQILNGQTMTIQSEKNTYVLTWRKAHDGGKNGLHLVSQPLSYRGDYFAYRLDFSMQTQAGRKDNHGNLVPWVFAHLSIQRYITDTFRKGNRDRKVSILVGNNQAQFQGWDWDTTLIRLSISRDGESWVWDDGVGGLLDDFGSQKLLSPDIILNQPAQYGNYDSNPQYQDNEYRLVYAEGHKLGGEITNGRKHGIFTGTSLRERSSIMEGVLTLLGGWLEIGEGLPLDLQTPMKTLALRDYDHMIKDDKKGIKKAAWRETVMRMLRHGQYEHLHIAVLYRNDEFIQHVIPQLEKILMGMDKETPPLVSITKHLLSPMLTAPLDANGLDHKLYFDRNRPKDFRSKWYEQMRASFSPKRQEWQDFLRQIDWKPNARRLVLIDSARLEKDHPSNQSIKGAVRDACNHEGISSQFLFGNFKMDNREGKQDQLKPEAKGRIKNAILDLVLRQQGILYAPPSEIYALAAGVDPQIASQLDVIAFCRLEKHLPQLTYTLAVRLSANGAVHFMLPHVDQWLKHDEAVREIGRLFSEHRVIIYSNKKTSLLMRMTNEAMRIFVEKVLTKHLDHPTIAVIEAAGWRNGAGSDTKYHCWTQLRNKDLVKSLDELHFGSFNKYERSAPALKNLMAVVRLRMNDETPQYITAPDFADEDEMRDIPYLTGYTDTTVRNPFHYFSVAGLPETQSRQDNKHIRQSFKADIKADERDDLPFKHPQLVEMVPFFVHPNFQSDEGLRQICRCVHMLRISPGFTMGDILTPYPMHLGESLIEDQLCIVGVDD